MALYEVMTEQEAMQERYQLLPEGDYDAVIESSEDKTSNASGCFMLDMTLHVFDAQGTPHLVRDFLVFHRKMMWKVLHFASSAGLMAEYNDQKLCSQVAVGNRVRVKIGIEEGGLIPEDKLKGKPSGSKYPDKNRVLDYLKVEASDRIPVKTKEIQEFLEGEEDVPF